LTGESFRDILFPIMSLTKIVNKKQNKKYRFFYHYFKAKNKLSVHWMGACHVVNNVVCDVSCESHWQKSQPRLIMRGFATEVTMIDDVAHIK